MPTGASRQWFATGTRATASCSGSCCSRAPSPRRCRTATTTCSRRSPDSLGTAFDPSAARHVTARARWALGLLARSPGLGLPVLVLLIFVLARLVSGAVALLAYHRERTLQLQSRNDLESELLVHLLRKDDTLHSHSPPNGQPPGGGHLANQRAPYQLHDGVVVGPADRRQPGVLPAARLAPGADRPVGLRRRRALDLPHHPQRIELRSRTSCPRTIR